MPAGFLGKAAPVLSGRKVNRPTPPPHADAGRGFAVLSPPSSPHRTTSAPALSSSAGSPHARRPALSADLAPCWGLSSWVSSSACHELTPKERHVTSKKRPLWFREALGIYADTEPFDTPGSIDVFLPQPNWVSKAGVARWRFSR